jgi:hypothetical protein
MWVSARRPASITGERMDEPGLIAVDALLPNEEPGALLEEHRRRRILLYQQLRKVPPEAFAKLQYLQPQIGCFNRCAFCSQHAGTDVWQLTRNGLRDLMAAIRMVVAETSPGRIAIGGERVHKPSVIFPYVDNDIGSYAHLDEYIELVHRLFAGKVRITTVGFSENNASLVTMHRRIATHLSPGVAGVRMSVTPFTYGWHAGERPGNATSRHQFWRDFATTLNAYRPLIRKLGPGKEAVSVELRFRPHVVVSDVVDTVVDGRHVVLAGPHLLISRGGRNRPVESRVSGVRNNVPGRRDDTVAPEPVFSADASPYLHVVSDSLAGADVAEAVRHALADAGDPSEERVVNVYRVAHQDGPYYAVNPTFAANGSMRSLTIYPPSRRRAGGYNDLTRHFLNALLAHKRSRGYARRAEFPDATVRDVVAVVLLMRRRAAELSGVDRRAATYIREEVIPLVRGYAWAFLTAGLSPPLFFSRKFTIDTGQAVNQGRGHVLFKGLVSRPDIAANPWEERANAISNSKGFIWRIAPAPIAVSPSGTLTPARHGEKNTPADEPSIIVEEIDPRHVQPRDFETGRPLRRYRITGVELEHRNLRAGRQNLLFPGLREEGPGK